MKKVFIIPVFFNIIFMFLNCELNNGEHTTTTKKITQLETPDYITASKGIYSDRVFIKWSEVPNAIEYEVYRSEKPQREGELLSDINGNYNLIAKTKRTFYNDKYCDSLIKFWYKIKAKNETQTSSFSIEAQGYKAVIIPPSLVEASKGDNYNTITLKWSKVNDALSYDIYKLINDNFSKINKNEITELFYEDRSYDKNIYNKLFYYYIESIGSNGRSIPSLVETGFFKDPTTDKDDLKPLSKPTGLASTDKIYSDRIIITWDKVEGAENYFIYKNDSTDDNNINFIELDSTTTNIYTDYYVESNYIYKYRIRAFSSKSGYSLYSNEVTGTIRD